MLLRAARKSRGDITAEETLLGSVRVWRARAWARVCVCLCARVQNASSLVAFVVYSISRVSLSSLTPRFRFPSSSFFFPVAATKRNVHMHACMHVRACSRVLNESSMRPTCRGSLPMHANPVSKFSKCTRKCITDEGDGRMKEPRERGQKGR